MGEKMSNKKEEFIKKKMKWFISNTVNIFSRIDGDQIVENLLQSIYDQGYSDANEEMRELLILEKNKNEHIENLTTSKADLFKREDFSNE